MKPMYVIKGIVENGKKRGRLLGFPTANMKLNKTIPEGIYISEVMLDEKTYQAATFVGSAQTFHETDYKLESYILDFDRDIYGKELTVKLYKKIRDNKKFASEKSLILQIKKDIDTTRRFFNQ